MTRGSYSIRAFSSATALLAPVKQAAPLYRSHIIEHTAGALSEAGILRAAFFKNLYSWNERSGVPGT
jgi:hypothetical protein